MTLRIQIKNCSQCLMALILNVQRTYQDELIYLKLMLRSLFFNHQKTHLRSRMFPIFKYIRMVLLYLRNLQTRILTNEFDKFIKLDKNELVRNNKSILKKVLSSIQKKYNTIKVKLDQFKCLR